MNCQSMKKTMILLIGALMLPVVFVSCERLPSVGDFEKEEDGTRSIMSVLDILDTDPLIGTYRFYDTPDTVAGEIYTYWTIDRSETDSTYSFQLLMQMFADQYKDGEVVSYATDLIETMPPESVERVFLEDKGEEGFLINWSTEQGDSQMKVWLGGDNGGNSGRTIYTCSNLGALYNTYFGDLIQPVPTDVVKNNTFRGGLPSGSNLDDLLGICSGDKFLYVPGFYVEIRFDCLEQGIWVATVGVRCQVLRKRVEYNYRFPRFYLRKVEVDEQNQQICCYHTSEDEVPYMRIAYLPTTGCVVLRWTPGDFFDGLVKHLVPVIDEELELHLYKDTYKPYE